MKETNNAMLTAKILIQALPLDIRLIMAGEIGNHR
jgi:hypothetical protein